MPSDSFPIDTSEPNFGSLACANISVRCFILVHKQAPLPLAWRLSLVSIFFFFYPSQISSMMMILTDKWQAYVQASALTRLSWLNMLQPFVILLNTHLMDWANSMFSSSLQDPRISLCRHQVAGLLFHGKLLLFSRIFPNTSCHDDQYHDGQHSHTLVFDEIAFDKAVDLNFL